MRQKTLSLIMVPAAFAILSLMTNCAQADSKKGKIVHDAEHNILKAQHGERWAKEDKEIDAKLAQIRKKNDGRPPNIFYILIDDIGFGDLGIPELNSVRGYETPNINKIADEGMRFTRMYTEPSCTPTRVAFMTGRSCPDHPRPLGEWGSGPAFLGLCRQ